MNGVDPAQTLTTGKQSKQKESKRSMNHWSKIENGVISTITKENSGWKLSMTNGTEDFEKVFPTLSEALEVYNEE